MSKATEFKDLTPDQQRYVVERYPNDGAREGYVYEISLRTGRFMCRHKKPKYSTSQIAK